MITSKLSLRQKQQELISELETVAGSLAIWAKEKFDNDDWSIADVKFALKNAARICDGVATKFSFLLVNIVPLRRMMMEAWRLIC